MPVETITFNADTQAHLRAWVECFVEYVDNFERDADCDCGLFYRDRDMWWCDAKVTGMTRKEVATAWFSSLETVTEKNFYAGL